MTDSKPIFANVSLWDGSITTLRLFKPRSRKNNEHSPLVMLWPGYGMGARYYVLVHENLLVVAFM